MLLCQSSNAVEFRFGVPRLAHCRAVFDLASVSRSLGGDLEYSAIGSTCK